MAYDNYIKVWAVSLGVAILCDVLMFFTFDMSIGGAIGAAIGFLVLSFMFLGFDTSPRAIGAKLFLVAGVIGSVYFASQVIQKTIDEDKYAMKVARRSDTSQSYKEYLRTHPDGAYVDAARDSVAAKELSRTYKLYKSDQFYEFVDTCTSPDIAKRAHRLLDQMYDKMKGCGETVTKEFMQAYVRNYEDGPHYYELKDELYYLEEVDVYEFAKRTGTIGAYNYYLEKYPDGPHASEVRSLIRDYKQAHKYDGNYLSSGSQPYANVYGRNGNYGQCAIKVEATGNTDVVVIVKHKDKNGKVAGHAYIHKGGSSSISLRPGTYQTFFYYGTSWNPSKKLDNGLVGGFMYDEQYGKDNPIDLKVSYSGDYIYYDQMTYSLQSVVGGNFSMKGASESDVF